MRPKAIGLIVNPMSGLGAAYNLNVARHLVQALHVDTIVAGPGQLGEDAVSSAQIISIGNAKGRAASQAVARASNSGTG